jgi:RimJ/RimL family protein N-acetyltransferase
LPRAESEGFETARLAVRALRGDELEALLPVYTSNPGYLALTEGAAGEPGRYDLEMLRRDYAVARMTPGRRLAGIFLRGSDEPVGVLDWLESNPSDGKPWVGLVMIRADRQRRGFASEALAGLLEQLRAGGAPAVRAGVIDRNDAGRALTRRLGFAPVSSTTMRMASEEPVTVLEREL